MKQNTHDGKASEISCLTRFSHSHSGDAMSHVLLPVTGISNLLFITDIKNENTAFK